VRGSSRQAEAKGKLAEPLYVFGAAGCRRQPQPVNLAAPLEHCPFATRQAYGFDP
jgi:hypothetical protein